MEMQEILPRDFLCSKKKLEQLGLLTHPNAFNQALESQDSLLLRAAIAGHRHFADDTEVFLLSKVDTRL